ncbi:hypothetical protein Tco_0870337, partial [Tanacetum coccineum]
SFEGIPIRCFLVFINMILEQKKAPNMSCDMDGLFIHKIGTLKDGDLMITIIVHENKKMQYQQDLILLESQSYGNNRFSCLWNLRDLLIYSGDDYLECVDHGSSIGYGWVNYGKDMGALLSLYCWVKWLMLLALSDVGQQTHLDLG